MCKGCELLLKWDMPERIPEPMNKMNSFDHVVLLISIQIAEYGCALRGFFVRTTTRVAVVADLTASNEKI